MRIVVVQLGARMHYAVPSILERAGVLSSLVTDITSAKGWPRLLGLLPKGFLPASARRLAARLPRDIPPHKITAFTSFAWQYARRLAACKSAADLSSTYLWAGRRFCQLTLERGFGNAQGVYTFNTAGLEVLQAAGRLGLKTVMEQTIAPKRIELQLLAQEHQVWPDWEESPVRDPFTAELMEREEDEWKAADLIVCGSDFVRDGIRQCGGPADKCVVVPYGVDVSVQKSEVRGQKPEVGSRPLRVLTVGAVGLRKGSPYVLEAAKQLGGMAEFRMVGAIDVNQGAEDQLRKHIELAGTVPRSEVARHFAWADVFLLPSVCEGSATATYEALAWGLPVVCTPNTGSVVRDGVDGCLVPLAEPSAIVARMESFIREPERLDFMSQNALQRAKEFSVAEYGRRLLSVLPS